jgi:outer membrane immunogenic protein
MEGEMRKSILFAAAAVAFLGIPASGQAADMPVKAPMMPPPPPPFSWTGFYIGGNLGGARANVNVTDSFSGQTFSRSSDSVFIGGGQIGYNYQFNTFVLGFEWDFDAVANNNDRVGNGLLILGNGPFAVTGGGDRWISTLAARLGFAVDHSLFYAKLGGGEVSARGLTVTYTGPGVANGQFVNGASRTASGFMFGVGWEYAFTNNLTMKVEYDHVDISSTRSFTLAANLPGVIAPIAGDVFRNRDTSVQMFKVGLNYLFGRGGY